MRLIQLEKPKNKHTGTAFERWGREEPPRSRAAAYENWQRKGLKIVRDSIPDSVDPSRRKVIGSSIFALAFQIERGTVGNPIPSGSTEKVIKAIERIGKLSRDLEADGLLEGSTLPQERARLKQYLFENLEENHGPSITATRDWTILSILGTLAEDHTPARARRVFLDVAASLGKPLNTVSDAMLKKIWDTRFENNFIAFLQNRRAKLATKIP